MIKINKAKFIYNLGDKNGLAAKIEAIPGIQTILEDDLSYPDGKVPTAVWARGFSNPVPKSGDAGAYLMANKHGIGIDLPAAAQYSGAAFVTIGGIAGDFDATVSFQAANFQQGSTLELAAISINADRVGIGAGAADGNPAAMPSRLSPQRGDVSLIFDVHGTPPYVSSECDESDGFRIGWNQSFNLTKTRPASEEDATPLIISDNAFNSYGKTVPASLKPFDSWQLRLIRVGNEFASYYKKEGNNAWVCSGAVRNDSMPQTVHLRLAAKHWLKDGLKVAPANRVMFKDFSVRAQPQGSVHSIESLKNMKSAHFTPTEVALPQEVRGCMKCDYFWPTDAPVSRTGMPFGRFGPYPIIKIQHIQANKPVTQAGAPQPAILKGCRKAPIMHIGINPNLKNFSMLADPDDKKRMFNEESTKGTRTAYPLFDNDQDYAKYYRRVDETKHLYQMNLASMEKLLDTSLPVFKAKADGLDVGGKRDPAERKISSWSQHDALQEIRDNENLPITSVTQWSGQENFLVLRSKPKKDEITAAYITETSLEGKTVDLEKIPDGYYKNVNALCNKLGIKIGEDVSMHDVVACASVGWVDKYKIKKDEVQPNCLGGSQRYILRQVLQSRPAAMVFSGQEALRMLVDCFVDQSGESLLSGQIPDGLNNKKVKLDMQEWLRDQAQGFSTYDKKPVEPTLLKMAWLNADGGAQHWTCRIIPMLHFSYSDNLQAHIHWRLEEQDIFFKRFPVLAAALDSQKIAYARTEIPRLIKNEPDAAFYGIRFKKDENIDSLLQFASESEKEEAKKYLERYLLDPYDLAHKIYSQIKALPDSLIKEAEFPGAKLKRALGQCSYCPSYEEACDYGVKASTENDEHIVSQLVAQLKPYTYRV